MIALLKALLTNKYAVGAVLVLAVLAAIWGYGLHRYHQGKADGAVEGQLAAAKEYRSQMEDLNRAVTQAQSVNEKADHEQPKTITKYRDRVVKVPLPADCHIDAGRLHDIQSAVHAANAARESGGTVR